MLRDTQLSRQGAQGALQAREGGLFSAAGRPVANVPAERMHDGKENANREKLEAEALEETTMAPAATGTQLTPHRPCASGQG
jgi:hypothetical protein